ncbi:lipopolysaccharide biosynthesis protein [Providencia sp. PROV039]|uniref:lipopolysaccharide biosynthesis protein n=1 Tax=Providencia sp. PROV039 TaxID=2949770 RepID=UPI00234B0F85|nr:oligosaccharide flippase family protein [Providencia sp. PROV039]
MIIKLFSQSFFGSVVYAITQWMIISSITRVLSVDSTGEYATSLGIVTTINIFFGFGIRQISYSSTENWVKKLYLPVIFLQLISLSISLIISLIFYPSLLLLTLFLSLFKLIETLTEYQYGLYQLKDNHKKIAQSRVVRSIVYTTFFIIALISSKNIILATASMFFANLILFFVVDKIKLSDLSSANFNNNLIHVVHLGFPLAITAAFLSLRSTSPRFILEHYMGYETVGVFVSYLYLINAGNMIVQAWAQVIAPKVSKFFNQKDITSLVDIKRKGELFIFSYCLIFAFALYVFHGEIIYIIYGNNIEINSYIALSLVVLMVTTYISSYNGYILTAIKEFKVQPKIFGFLFILSLLLTIYLARSYGLVHIIYGLSLVCILQIVLLKFFYSKKIKKQ